MEIHPRSDPSRDAKVRSENSFSVRPRTKLRGLESINLSEHNDIEDHPTAKLPQRRPREGGKHVSSRGGKDDTVLEVRARLTISTLHILVL